MFLYDPWEKEEYIVIVSASGPSCTGTFMQLTVRAGAAGAKSNAIHAHHFIIV